MEQYHGPSKTKSSGSGGLKRRPYDRKLRETGGRFTETKMGEEKRRVKRAKGGNRKTRLLSTMFVNVSTKEGNKKVKFVSILESHNREYIRQNIITKGTVVQTELGKVRITSRPGQHGVLNGVLIP